MTRATNSLWESFESLQRATLEDGEHSFAATAVPNGRAHRLAKDANGLPSYLLAVSSRQTTRSQPTVRLQYLSVEYDRDCVISREDGPKDRARFTIVRCTSSDVALQRYFVDVVGLVVTAMGASPTTGEIRRAIDQLVQLFLALTDPPRGTVQGLWGELLVMQLSNDPHALVSAWHVDPNDRYDFNTGSQRIEVKTCSGEVRRHHFALVQLTPPPGAEVMIASMFVHRAGGGLAIADIVSLLSQRLRADIDAVMRVETVVATTLGSSWRDASELRFDLEAARHSFRFFDSGSVPTLAPTLPAGVTDVRFQAELTLDHAIAPATLNRKGGLFAAAKPRRSISRASQ